jgi:hypothetical protein
LDFARACSGNETAVIQSRSRGNQHGAAGKIPELSLADRGVESTFAILLLKKGRE